MSRRIVLGPFNRVEGDLEVSLDIADGMVRAAQVNSPLYRGFEQILQGKAPMDALALVPRICGICSVAQSAAAAQALAAAMDIVPPKNGRLAADLTLGAENLADHLTHFYLFFMPDFARAAYRDRPWFAATEARFKAQVGSAGQEVLAARSAFMRALGLLAGKWPHTLSLQPGGSSSPLQASEKTRLYRHLRDFRRFCETVLFGDRLEAIAELADEADLARWLAQHRDRSDFARFLALADDLQLHTLGRATDVFLSVGAYANDGNPWLARGVWDAQGLSPLDPDQISEDLSHAWYAEAEEAQSPAKGSTLPQADKADAYSWCKAPRLAGRVVETGALARQLVAGHPLARDLVARHGGNVKNRVVARLLEIARVLIAMEGWAQALQPGEPYCFFGELPDEADSVGLVEAARGSLGHWLSIRRGRIHNYQIIAPTTWNFSPRDSAGTPGALEQALAGTPVGDGDDTLPSVQHIVRSFDPCMVCTVH
ncbi:nickel-dependent hydrogenase large subunit [Denitratisoma sp. agr-D3]